MIPKSVEILPLSKCTNKSQEKAYLKLIMGNRTFETFLLYRGSRDGWTGKDFHSRCDDKGATLTLYKIKDGSCFGGYTSVPWNSGTRTQCDKTAMIFHLTQKRFFPCKSHDT
jgi:hypothetical protein